MRRLLMGAVLMVTFVAVTQAEMTLIDDFDSYDVDSSIHLQGLDAVDGGPRWYAQANNDSLTDSRRAFVVDDGGNQCLRATSQDDTADTPNYNVISMSMSDYAIYDEGTLYLRFKHPGEPNDFALQTNDKWPGWDYGHFETGTVQAPSFQGNLAGACWKESGATAHFAGGWQGAGWFRGRDGSSANPGADGTYAYRDVQVNTHANEWTELWVQVDQTNDRSKFFICPDGGTPTIVMNPAGGEWWAMRNETRDNNAVLNVRFMIGYVWGDPQVRTLYLDDIAADNTAFTLDRPDVGHGISGDLDGDGDVDLDDFVILKTSFGTDDGGDCDGDGDTDLDDFVILKQNFGRTS